MKNYVPEDRMEHTQAVQPPKIATSEALYAGFGIKPTNPKDVAGTARIDLSLVDPIAVGEMILAMEEGVAKYGAYNYTVLGVRARVYISAALRHLFKYLMGEDRDPKTGVHHIGSTMACCMILLSAAARGKLTDDRPPSNRRASDQLDGLEARVRKVREVFDSYKPRHYTIEDTQHEQGTREQDDRRHPPADPEGYSHREDAQPVPGRDR